MRSLNDESFRYSDKIVEEDLETIFINKSTVKNKVNIKLIADYNINKLQIYSYLAILVFSILLKIRPFNCSLGFLLPILFIVPYSIMLMGLEFKDSYLFESNSLARKFVSLTFYFVFVIVSSFIVLLILKEAKVQFFQNFSMLIYFVPIYGLLLVLDLVWIFLFYGFMKLEEKAQYFLILGNLIFYSTLGLIVFLKLSTVSNMLSWSNLGFITILVELCNFLSWIQRNLKKKFKEDFKDKSLDSINVITKVIGCISISLLIYLIGMLLDEKLEKNNEIFIYISAWVFCTVSLSNNLNTIAKIKSFFEWRKNVLI
jgi:hypothetical protein